MAPDVGLGERSVIACVFEIKGKLPDKVKEDETDPFN